MTDYGDELVTIVEVDVDFCSLTYGESPCAAVLGDTGSTKCYNTAATCQDRDNYSPGTLTLRFGRPQAGIERYGPIIPSLESVNISPLEINLMGMASDVSPFGRRETCDLQFRDHQHSDVIVDPYRTERLSGDAQADGTGFNPHERGTFWSKFVARNPYYEGFRVRVYEGSMGQDLADMRVRHYIIDRIDGPDDKGVTVECKDLFTLVEERKAKAPRASGGRVANDGGIGAGSGETIQLTPVGIGDEDYPTSGRVAIGDEIAEFSRSGDDMTLDTRGVLGTPAEGHDEDDRVQLVLSYEGEQAQDIVYDLLTEYANVDPARIPKAEWDSEANEYLQTQYTAHLPEPESVEDLIGELTVQAGFTIFPRVDTDEIKLRAIVGSRFGSEGALISDERDIRQDSLEIERKPDRRVSQVWVYHGIRNWIEDVEEPSNYASRRIVADLQAESDEEYGQKSIKEVYGRWLPRYAGAPAETCGERILSLYRDTPFRATFSLDVSMDGKLQLAERLRLLCAELVDATGARIERSATPYKLHRDSDQVRVGAQQLRFFEPPDKDTFPIEIDSDGNTLNLRDIFEQLYGEPESGITVPVSIFEGVVIGGNLNTPAFNVGSWPENVTIEITNNGLIAGAQGNGGRGGNAGLDTSNDGSNGGVGGEAFYARYDVNLTNNGIIGGGGGGGAGGGGATALYDSAGTTLIQCASGGGGGAGGGVVDGNPGGDGGFNSCSTSDSGSNGSTGTNENGGAGGGGGYYEFFDDETDQLIVTDGGSGGAGGDLGQSGSNGQNGSASGGDTDVDPNPNISGSGGAGGGPGNAVNGDSYVTFATQGDIRGPRVN